MFPEASKHTRNEFSMRRSSLPSAPPAQSWLVQVESQMVGLDQLPQENPGHVVGAMQDLGLIALPSGSTDSAAGVCGITASALDATLSSTASPCNCSGLTDGATVHAPTAHTSINRSALRIMVTLLGGWILASANRPSTQPIFRCVFPRSSEQQPASDDKHARPQSSQDIQGVIDVVLCCRETYQYVRIAT
jgi:hypothetical protein